MKKVFVWGVGKYYDVIKNALKSEKCILLGVVDSNDERREELADNGILVHSPDILNSEDMDYIIISAKNSTGIIRRCEELGIQESKIIDFWRTEKEYEFIDGNIKRIHELEEEVARCKRQIKNMPYELGIKPVPTIKSSEELLELLIRDKKSLSRFGDGELEIMQKRTRPWFQIVDKILSERLREVFKSNEKRLIVALADDFGCLEQYTDSGADAIREYLDNGIRELLMKEIDLNRVYYDAYVTRPYMMYKDKKNAGYIFELFKKVWYKRDILLVEGENSYIGIRNDLFDGAKSVKRIIAPAKNAFSKYDEILLVSTHFADKDTLVLISLGPTATVLAYDLTLLGIQALDIGQIDNEYEWYLRGVNERTEIAGKCVAELNHWHNVVRIEDEDYQKQIVAKV